MIYHSVFFKLKHPQNSQQESRFLDAARGLSAIPGVQHLEVLKQTSPKNNFDYGLLMEFTDQQVYDNYSDHPDHVLFIEQFWLKDVEDFLEIDYEKIIS
ncbi:hypothetical protein DYBT9275_02474 [Dyadobacter sp. CECT 9275]|uniref:Stress-response A/B barrel domain-containing protein n=1 Tax=Dyadobacter helix TaxID=2822344 RepID=A0A916JFQ4_9BACT|nr:Dabb family protein [Dyadobacter sp. CECT 9275]CAG5000490.1 hypothetical protein DYBT9275_02474 [Dyadobacter sp. CECT 9275]